MSTSSNCAHDGARSDLLQMYQGAGVLGRTPASCKAREGENIDHLLYSSSHSPVWPGCSQRRASVPSAPPPDCRCLQLPEQRCGLPCSSMSWTRRRWGSPLVTRRLPWWDMSSRQRGHHDRTGRSGHSPFPSSEVADPHHDRMPTSSAVSLSPSRPAEDPSSSPAAQAFDPRRKCATIGWYLHRAFATVATIVDATGGPVAPANYAFGHFDEFHRGESPPSLFGGSASRRCSHIPGRSPRLPSQSQQGARGMRGQPVRFRVDWSKSRAGSWSWTSPAASSSASRKALVVVSIWRAVSSSV